MHKPLLKTLVGAGCVSLAAIGTAGAGGLERGGYNIDLLFDPSRFASEVSATYVMPQRELDNVVDTDASDGPGGPRGLGGGDSDGVRETEDYWVPRVGLKAGFGEHVDCMVDYSQPWGAHTNPGDDWVGTNSNIETKVNSDNYAGTCSYKMDAGKGQFRVLGGVFYQELDGFKERQVIPDIVVIPTPGGPMPFNPAGSGVGRLDLEADGVGWRIGAAYEIPEIAFRASLVYNSEVELDEITGTVDLTEVSPDVLSPTDPRRALFGRVTDVYGEAAMPDSLEFKIQSGIAPDWLAFGSVKWVDWSQLQSVVFCPTSTKGVIECNSTSPARATSLDLLYRDGWTVSAGVGHKFNDQWSGAASIAWDRGTSTGLGTQTDTWTFSAGAAYTPTKNMEFRLGGALGVLTSGSSGAVVGDDGITYGDDVTYDFGDDLVAAISASAKIRW
jgi:long-chain fatty acid transport protein